MPVRIDTLRGVNGSAWMSAAGYGDTWAVTWFQLALVSPDSQNHWKGRFFDGAAFTAEQELGTDVWASENALVSDGIGHAFVQRYASAGGDRRVFDFSNGTFSSTQSFSLSQSGLEPMALAAIPGGGALSLYRNGTNTVADKWLPSQPTWTTTGLAGVPALVNGLRIVVNAAGKAAAMWYVSDGSGTDVTVTPYDGSSWGTSVTKNLPIAEGSVGNTEAAIYTNGDVLLAWPQGPNSLNTVRFAASTGAFGSKVPVDPNTGAGAGGVAVVIDPADRAIVTWIRNGHVFISQDGGTGFSAPEDVAAATSYRLGVDRATSEVTLLSYNSPTLSLQRVHANQSIGTMVPTNMGVSSTMTLSRHAAVVFESTGRPTVFAMQDVAGPGGLGLAYAKCH